MEYKTTFTARRTVGIYVHKDGLVEVKCPKHTSKAIIENIIAKKKDWIEKAQKRLSERKENDYKTTITESERLKFVEKANSVIPQRVEYYSKIMQVIPAKVKISSAKSYWGSCSGKNVISFSWRIIMASDKTIDYVVVHELSHIKQHNHSKKFWAEVEKIIPKYKDCKKELRELQRKID
jgi:predicted metal-dependent hydrolase